jgi:hypothetical protein
VEYVSRVPGPPLDGLIDDLYYLEGAPPYSRLMLPAAPAPLLIVNLGAPFLIRAGTDVEAVEYADGCAVTTPTRAWEFSYPTPTRSVGVHFRPWGLVAQLGRGHRQERRQHCRSCKKSIGGIPPLSRVPSLVRRLQVVKIVDQPVQRRTGHPGHILHADIIADGPSGSRAAASLEPAPIPDGRPGALVPNYFDLSVS